MLRTVIGLAVTALIAVGIFVAFNNRTVATSGEDAASGDSVTAIVCACENCETAHKCCSGDSVACEDCVCKSCGCETCKAKTDNAVAACACENCETAHKCCSGDSVDCEDCVCKSCGCETCADKT